jgi:hypothetical protein
VVITTSQTEIVTRISVMMTYVNFNQSCIMYVNHSGAMPARCGEGQMRIHFWKDPKGRFGFSLIEQQDCRP